MLASCLEGHVIFAIQGSQKIGHSMDAEGAGKTGNKKRQISK
ncbi:hypothetical protein VRRI112168_14165 [Vreelandella rituensis]